MYYSATDLGCKCVLHFYRRVIEVPSLDWREVSEHFYGNCCCASFGAQAELLAARFQQLLTSSEGTCLVASTTCIVHKGDVILSEGDSDGPAAAKLLHCGKNDRDPCVVGHIGVETSHVHISDREDRKQKTNESSKKKSCAGDSNGSEHHSNKVEVNLDSDNKLNHRQNGGDGRTTAEEIQDGHFSVNKVSPEGFENQTHQDTVEEPCCSSSCSSRNSASAELSFLKEGKDASPESLGNGFMTGSRSEVLDWEPFFCRSCSSLVGARRGDSSKNGLQFFKCQISTNKSVLSSSNIFR